MILPNVAQAVQLLERQHTYRNYVKTRVDFVDTFVPNDTQIFMVVQPAERTKLAIDQVDDSLEYIQVHSRQRLQVNNFILFEGMEYKVITPGNYGQYGYWEQVGEEVKRARS